MCGPLSYSTQISELEGNTMDCCRGARTSRRNCDNSNSSGTAAWRSAFIEFLPYWLEQSTSGPLMDAARSVEKATDFVQENNNDLLVP